MKTFSIIFSLLGFIVKKKNRKLYFFSTLPHFLGNQTQPHNHTTKYNHKTYRKGNGCLRSALHFLSIVLMQGAPLHDQCTGKWVFWVLTHRRGENGEEMGLHIFSIRKYYFFITLILRVKKCLRIEIIFQYTAF